MLIQLTTLSNSLSESYQAKFASHKDHNSKSCNESSNTSSPKDLSSPKDFAHVRSPPSLKTSMRLQKLQHMRLVQERDDQSHVRKGGGRSANRRKMNSKYSRIYTPIGSKMGSCSALSHSLERQFNARDLTNDLNSPGPSPRPEQMSHTQDDHVSDTEHSLSDHEMDQRSDNGDQNRDQGNQIVDQSV